MMAESEQILTKIRLIEERVYFLAKVVGGNVADPGEYFREMDNVEISSHIYNLGVELTDLRELNE